MGMLPELHKLVCTVLTIPITTRTAERSFSALRCLKTFLRSTMGQRRLNSAALLNVHKDLHMQLNFNKLANEFYRQTKYFSRGGRELDTVNSMSRVTCDYFAITGITCVFYCSF